MTTTDNPPDDAMRALAQAAAADIAQGSKASDLRELVRAVQHDERAACRVGRAVAAALREWLGNTEP